ncbi:IS4 family transposase [Enterococcus sp. 669A]|uniref:IS4 family transposase n=1 Tax=Candidatus Enterococcus moelleringii TaxID=2815325 RepID=A0ABS3L740_9ENTE|nr:IS4 family transposase [Enterococcus sp. 669A]MBO1305429.1 IS4 family transposase [Enterococcus sp. 669A]
MKIQGDFQGFIQEAQVIYLEDIREGNPQAFTRKRKTTPLKLMLQMFSQRGHSQFSELLNFYGDQDKPLDISTVAFYNARMKYNPKAIHLMMADYLSMVYEKYDDQLAKLNGYIITAIDGSDIILPSTDENAEKYGVHATSSSVGPVMAKVSLLYDCVNKIALDTCIEPYNTSERDCAAKHLDQLKTILRQPTITTFDRGYYSMKLVDQLIENDQKFVMRMKRNDLKRYTEHLDSGDDQTFTATFDRFQTNHYRKERAFRTKLMNTTYSLRFVKIPLINSTTGKTSEELLMTNLTQAEFSLEGLKELYRLRWEIETVYNIIKNRMKLEEFSGIRERLILQDIYCCVWFYNLVMLYIIEINEENKIAQEQYKYEMRRNIGISIGIMKTYFLQSVIGETEEKRNQCIEEMGKLIIKHLVPIRPNRTSKRQTPVNKSRRSYRYTY